MKTGWQTKKVSEIAKHSLGKMLDKAKNKGEPKPYLRNLNVRWFDFDLSDVLEMPFLPTESEKYTAVKGDVLICEGGYPGRAAIWEQDEPIYFQKALHRVRFHEPERNKWFVYYLQFRDLEGTLRKHFNGAGIQHFTGEALAQFEIPVPPLAEQERIVGVLDEAFAGLATAQAHAAKNHQNARALFESHLQSVFTHRGKGWVEKSVADLVAEGALVKPFDGNHGEIHPKKSDYTESGVPFIMARDLQDGLVDSEHCVFISQKLADSLRVGFAKDGDVLISHKGTIGRSAIVSTDDDYIMLTPQVTSYRVKDSSKLFNRFIHYYFMSPGFQREMIAGAADGSTRAYIGITKQLTLRFRFPPLAEQKRIAAELDVLDPETQRLATLYARKQAALAALKQSLLHQAFSGEL
ncbi:MAG: restriction endonuclease subunit S [Limisphaerales bacterium]